MEEGESSAEGMSENYSEESEADSDVSDFSENGSPPPAEPKEAARSIPYDRIDKAQPKFPEAHSLQLVNKQATPSGRVMMPSAGRGTFQQPSQLPSPLHMDLSMSSMPRQPFLDPKMQQQQMLQQPGKQMRPQTQPQQPSLPHRSMQQPSSSSMVGSSMHTATAQTQLSHATSSASSMPQHSSFGQSYPQHVSPPMTSPSYSSLSPARSFESGFPPTSQSHVPPPLFHSSSSSSQQQSNSAPGPQAQSEECRIGNTTIVLPTNLFQVRDLSGVFNMETWETVLNEAERERLRALLPPGSPAEQSKIVSQLFSGENFFFGNPVQRLGRSLRAGRYHPEVSKYYSRCLLLMKKQHTQSLRDYHNRFIRRLIHFRKKRLRKLQLTTEPPGANHSTAPSAPGGPSGQGNGSPFLGGKGGPNRGGASLTKRPSTFLKGQSGQQQRGGQREEDDDSLSDDSEQDDKKSRLQHSQFGSSSRNRRLESSSKPKPAKDSDSGSLSSGGSEESSGERSDDDSMQHSKSKHRSSHSSYFEAHGPSPSIRSKGKNPKASPSSPRPVPSPVPSAAPSQTPAPLFSTMRDCFFSKPTYTCSIDDLVQTVLSSRLASDRIPPDTQVRDFVVSAVTFLASPNSPIRVPMGDGQEPTYSPPSQPTKFKALIIGNDDSRTWTWSSPDDMDVADLVAMESRFLDAFSTKFQANADTAEGRGKLSLKHQKCLLTIRASSPETKRIFRMQERERYQHPEQPYTYSIKGMRTAVAPMKKAGPGSKPRDHFLLKPDRPAHVTILSLVRDAAARLPGGAGTRADVCELLRDSQYIIENVTDAQLNQIVSGALDRLHYEYDPCVKFEPERKIWSYLHKDRTPEDFVPVTNQKQPPKKRRRENAASHSSTPTSSHGQSASMPTEHKSKIAPADPLLSRPDRDRDREGQYGRPLEGWPAPPTLAGSSKAPFRSPLHSFPPDLTGRGVGGPPQRISAGDGRGRPVPDEEELFDSENDTDSEGDDDLDDGQ